MWVGCIKGMHPFDVLIRWVDGIYVISNGLTGCTKSMYEKGVLIGYDERMC